MLLFLLLVLLLHLLRDGGVLHEALHLLEGRRVGHHPLHGLHGGGIAQLYSIDLTGYNERRIVTPAGASDPAWSPLLR